MGSFSFPFLVLPFHIFGYSLSMIFLSWLFFHQRSFIRPVCFTIFFLFLLQFHIIIRRWLSFGRLTVALPFSPLPLQYYHCFYLLLPGNAHVVRKEITRMMRNKNDGFGLTQNTIQKPKRGRNCINKININTIELNTYSYVQRRFKCEKETYQRKWKQCLTQQFV